jgi:D-sedoheptulose 7-phosphate isomerase
MASQFTSRNDLVGDRSGIHTADQYFARLSAVLREVAYDRIDQITTTLIRAYEENRTVFLFGNGGSAALASHAACDLGKGTAIDDKKRFRVLALTDNIPVITAWANDSSYEEIFAEQLRNFVQAGDIVLAISGSGNSPNVLKALRVGRNAGAYTIGLTGFQGGKMKQLCDLCLIVPSDNMQFIEDVHVCISHSIFTAFRTRLVTSAAASRVISESAVGAKPEAAAVNFD